MEELIPITMFMCIAAVMILRPLTRRLGGLLEAMTRDRTAPAQMQEHTSERTIALLEHISRRIDLMEERLDFTERLIATRSPELRRSTQRPPLSTQAAGAEYLAR
jgi:hypothetical protein